MKKWMTTAAMISSLIAAPGLTWAENAYIGASWGYTGLEDNSSDLDTNLAASGYNSSTTLDDSDSGFKVFGGYRFNDSWSLEVGYMDFGSFSYSGSETTLPATYTGNIEVTTWYVAGNLMVPFTDSFAANLKLGAARWDSDASISLATFATNVGTTVEDKGTAAMFGIGGQFNITDTWAIRVDLDRVAADDNLDLVSVGLQAAF